MKRYITNALILVMVIMCGGIVAALGSRLDAAAAPANTSDGIYINYGHGDTIDVIDFGTNKVVRTIKGIPGMHGMSSLPMGNGSMLLVTLRSCSALWIKKPGKLSKRFLSAVPPTARWRLPRMESGFLSVSGMHGLKKSQIAEAH